MHPSNLRDAMQIGDEIFAQRFRIHDEAGFGGMGTVYRAFDEARGEVVALKIVRTADPAVVKRFDTEARALAQLQHPAIVRYVAHGVDAEGDPYLAMEWIEGESLHTRLQRGTLDLAEAITLGKRIAQALDAAHALGILHLDIKPGNVLLPAKDAGQAKLTDFGLARAIGGDVDTVSRPLAWPGSPPAGIVGTPGYMAPEQARGAGDLDGRADLFALGCLLYRCLTGIGPFDGVRGLTAAACVALLEPPPVSELRAGIPAPFERLVSDLLAKDSAERPPSAAVVHDALERIAKESNKPAPPLPSEARTLESASNVFFARYMVEDERLDAGRAFRALDPELGRRVALKLLSGPRDRIGVARLLRAARQAASLNHPNIAAIYDVGEHAGIPFVAREYIPGKSLRGCMENDAPACFDRRVRWSIAIASGLAAAHRAGVVHGALSPDSVAVDDAGSDAEGAVASIKILDFGLALAGEITLAAKAAYMAPEQMDGEPPDARADQFAWAVTAFELLTGRLPSPGEPHAGAIRASLAVETTASAAPPAKIAHAIATALHENPDQRFPSMDALLLELLPPAPSAPDVDRSSVPARSAESSPRRPTRAWLALAPVVLGFGLFAHARPLAAPPAAHAPSEGTEDASAVRITDRQASPACAPEAVALYKQGLQLLRQANWNDAHDTFERAAQTDPSCAQVQLRLTMAGYAFRSPAERRQQMGRALALQDELDDRDRLVLEAMVHLMTEESPKEEASQRILDEATRRFPNDAELFHMAIWKFYRRPLDYDLRTNLARVERATELDPEYADAWRSKAILLGMLNRPTEELAALDRCLKIAPGGTDCMRQRILALRSLGRCDEAVEEARRWIKWDPDRPFAYEALATCMASRPEATRDAIAEALSLAWQRYPATSGDSARLCASAELAVWDGNFDEALRVAKQIEGRAAGVEALERHWCATQAVIDALEESNQASQASAVAAWFVGRKAAWVNFDEEDRYDTSRPILLATMLEHGRTTRAAWFRATQTWERSEGLELPLLDRWLYRWGPAVGAQVSAKEALSHDPRARVPGESNDSEDSIHIDRLHESLIGMREAYEGRIRLYAGDTEAAIPLLEAASRGCFGLDQAALHVRSHLWLGLAKEKSGDRAGACAAFDGVVQRWGKAKPLSVTAQEAERHRQALRCGS